MEDDSIVMALVIFNKMTATLNHRVMCTGFLSAAPVTLRRTTWGSNSSHCCRNPGWLRWVVSCLVAAARSWIAEGDRRGRMAHSASLL
jgi:hypothetical protein